MSPPKEPTRQDLDALLVQFERLLAHAAGSEEGGESGMSRPYVQLLHREIGPSDYARRLQEMSEAECEAVTRLRLHTASRGALLARELELQVRRATLAEEYVGARREVAYAYHRSRIRAAWIRFSFELFLVAVVTAFLGTVWLNANLVSVANLLFSSVYSVVLFSAAVMGALCARVALQWPRLRATSDVYSSHMGNGRREHAHVS